jgi:hypothetical protein
MSSLVLGWFLIIAGALFVLVRLARAGRETFSAAAAPAAGTRGVIRDVARLLEALAKLPAWLMMVLVGVYLIYAGQQILASQLPWPL